MEDIFFDPWAAPFEPTSNAKSHWTDTPAFNPWATSQLMTDSIKGRPTKINQKLSPHKPHYTSDLVPPKTYQLQQDGWTSANARIWALPPSSSASKSRDDMPSLKYDDPLTFNPFASMIRSVESNIKESSTSNETFEFQLLDPAILPSTHYIKRVFWNDYELFEETPDGNGSFHSTKLLDFQNEALFGTTSTYTRLGGAQQAIMHKVQGLNPWWSFQRTLEDYDGIRYSCVADTWTNDITLTRLSDQMVVAKLARTIISWTGIGLLHILEPLPPELVDLILSAIFVKYICDRERRSSFALGALGFKSLNVL